MASLRYISDNPCYTGSCYLLFSCGCSLGFGKLGFAFVLDISGVTIFISLIGDDLCAAIWEGNTVRAGYHFPIAALRVRVIILWFFILNIPSEAVRLWGLSKESGLFYLNLYSTVYTYSLIRKYKDLRFLSLGQHQLEPNQRWRWQRRVRRGWGTIYTNKPRCFRKLEFVELKREPIFLRRHYLHDESCCEVSNNCVTDAFYRRLRTLYTVGRRVIEILHMGWAACVRWSSGIQVKGFPLAKNRAQHIRNSITTFLVGLCA